MTRLHLALAAALAVSFAAPSQADVALPGVFGDGMVLQRDLLVPVWGLAAPRERVTVSFAGQSKQATADVRGRWRVDLDPLSAGGPFELSVQASNQVRFTDVLVGEVWVCSGQSNMGWPVKRAHEGAAEAAKATHPKIRLLSVPRAASDTLRGSFSARWTKCSPTSVADFSAVAFFFGRELRRALDVPVGLIHASYGGTPAEAWVRREVLEDQRALAPLLTGWAERIAEWKPPPAPPKGKKPQRHPRTSPHRPSCLYNGMIRPLIPYAMRGVIWYQGEANAGRAQQYRSLFPTLIRSWRADWGQGEFPFLYVQLANFLAPDEEPQESAWAELREAQSLALELPNTGQAVAIDIGAARTIHPPNKQEVGRRLALLALNRTYGLAQVDTGPTYAFMAPPKEGQRDLVVRFENADGLTTRDGGPVKGFAIASDDTEFYWADAVIEGDTVRISSPQVKKPYAVRYAWSNNPECNLVNGAGLPAVPFRTDDFPGLTDGAATPPGWKKRRRKKTKKKKRGR